MSFHSWLYLPCFLGMAVLLYYCFPLKYRFLPLLLSSMAFYVLCSRKLIVFLAVTIVSVYAAARILDTFNEEFREKKKGLAKEERKQLKKQVERKKKAVLYLAVLLNFGILFVLKYGNFLGENINQALKALHVGGRIPVFQFLLPLGISFYTLQAAGYLLDVSRGKYRADKHFARVALFLSFFPQMVEGPIARYDETGHQVYEGHRFDYETFTSGLQLILWGLVKKVVLADRANMFVNTIFKQYEQYSGIYIVAAAVLYTFQIYTEFSGCMDIVRGSALLFGIQLPENFRQPFAAKTINEFWQRWHMTLGGWLRDYVFYAVSFCGWYQKFSKNCREKWPKFFGGWISAVGALFFVWFGMGLWHGASWKYVLYGMYYFALISIGMLLAPLGEKGMQRAGISPKSAGVQIVGKVRTTALVCVGMLFFRAESFTAGLSMLKSVFRDFSLQPLLEGKLLGLGCDGYDFAILGIGFVVVSLVGAWKERNINVREKISGFPLPFRWGVFYAGLFCVILFGAYGFGYNAADFIYAQF